eukprot:RCo030127
MALRYADGEFSALVLVQPPPKKRSEALERFLANFVGLYHLRAIPDDTDFCPARLTAMILSCLRQVTQSLPLLLLRVNGLVAKTRRIQAWVRHILRRREETIQQIVEHWA